MMLSPSCPHREGANSLYRLRFAAPLARVFIALFVSGVPPASPPTLANLPPSPYFVSCCRQALVDKPEIFEDLGFTASPGGSLGTPCLDFHFTVDEQSEIMGTRVS